MRLMTVDYFIMCGDYPLPWGVKNGNIYGRIIIGSGDGLNQLMIYPYIFAGVQPQV